MTISLQSTHLECLTSSAIPRAASGGQLEDPWEENLYFATWLLFPNLVEILEDNIQLIVLSSFFFLHLDAFGVSIANSHGSWGGDKWPSGRLESPENQQRVVNWQWGGRRVGRNENRTEEAQVLAPELHQVCANLFTLKSKRFQMETFSFVFIISLLYWDLSS